MDPRGWALPPELQGLPHQGSRPTGSRPTGSRLTGSRLTRSRLGPDDVTVTLFTLQSVGHQPVRIGTSLMKDQDFLSTPLVCAMNELHTGSDEDGGGDGGDEDVKEEDEDEMRW